jgi:molybdenum cofactor cytidylyltransferase
MQVAALVLAAGSSARLGRPKQLLPYDGGTLLGATLRAVHGAGFAQVVVALGGAADQVRDLVDLSGSDVVVNADHGAGCATSLQAALGVVRDDLDGIVLFLGDQPGVSPEVARRLVAAAAAAPLGVCRYDDGRGHPLWFRREVFAELRALHGDKAVWKLVDAGRSRGMVELRVEGPVPLDVDTEKDYERLLAGG